jgi:hypothetical protein
VAAALWIELGFCCAWCLGELGWVGYKAPHLGLKLSWASRLYVAQPSEYELGLLSPGLLNRRVELSWAVYYRDTLPGVTHSLTVHGAPVLVLNYSKLGSAVKWSPVPVVD